MGVAEKKAMREATETLTVATANACENTGCKFTTEIDFSSIENDATILTASAKVPTSIIQWVGELISDADYKEAFADVKTIKFVPTTEDGFDYEKSATLTSGTLTVNYLPMASMHGGYERAIKGLF